ncbi:hypothetical protein LOTGIDRAFT_231455 [Lottia gigantea]|uniref:Pyridoxal phosphate homeostasis protein n=1 Tax=Lottia gigantea TaxID=225164 RepID=V4AMR4_LOTGI|nr:hypothetical protein LOTGIDRAFT_231455 [Lottia gigantea]ESO98437.1 hypothetical protein LOTGIDRAFT_231455 [Lottia gigantea]
MASTTSKENIQTALKMVTDKMTCSAGKRVNQALPKPRLVAVSKTKPIQDIIAAYEAGQRNFGENYVMELVEKSHEKEILEKCEDIKWHFIGHLQRNKVSKVLMAPNLYMVETVESEKLAEAMDKSWSKNKLERKLDVMVQINTSGESNKHGCEPENVIKIVEFVREKCSNLNFRGLMTIGSFDHDLTKGPNPDFQKLLECRDLVCKETGIPIEELEISMGMSNDYEHAIELGSTNVRVGSTIFGARHYPNKTVPNESIHANGDVNDIQSKVEGLKVE